MTDPTAIDLDVIKANSFAMTGRMGLEDGDYLDKSVNDLIAAVEALREQAAVDLEQMTHMLGEIKAAEARVAELEARERS